jgi:hypothetical protein
MIKRLRGNLGLAVLAVALCLSGCPEDDEEAVADVTDGGTSSGNEAGKSGGEAGTSGSEAGTSGSEAGTSGGEAGTSGSEAGTSGGSTTGATSVAEYTGVTTDDCKSASPACELFCNMVCNNCAENQGAENGCGAAKGFAKDAKDDATWCMNCQGSGTSAWGTLCADLSGIPAPAVVCE